MVGLLFYMQEAGSPRALLLILLWIGLLVLDWTLMRRGVAGRSPRLRYAAYGTTALSVAAAAIAHHIFTAFETGPANYAPGYWTLSGRRCPAAARRSYMEGCCSDSSAGGSAREARNLPMI